MKWVWRTASVLGTLVAFLVTCLLIAATLAWLVRRWHAAPWVLWAVGLTLAAIAELQQHHVTTSEYFYLNHGPLVGRFGYDPFAEVHNTVILGDRGLAALLEHADDLPDLEWVVFDALDGVSDAGLARIEELNQFPKLRCGSFDGCRITDAGLERLTAWRRLEELRLANCPKITDSGLTHLKKLPNLTTLTLHQRHNARTMFVTDAGLAHVADLQQLQELRITRIPITDTGLDHLRDMPNLQRVILYKTEVTEAGARRLCEALPDCLVTWEEASFPAICQIRCIEIWRVRPAERLLATITDVDQIAAVKAWLEEAGKQRYPNCSGSPAYWRDGRGGACLSVRFQGRRRRMHEVGLGNGVYSRWGDYCDMMPVDDEAIRGLLGVDATDWNAGDDVD